VHLGSMYLSPVSCIREVCSSLYRALGQIPFTKYILCIREVFGTFLVCLSGWVVYGSI
jgi:hypothetical protein